MGQGQSSSALQSCLKASVGSSLFATPSTNLLYSIENVHQYNLDIPISPIAVTFPSTAQQVSSIIQCAAANKVNVQARGGGHSYGNYGMLRSTDS